MERLDACVVSASMILASVSAEVATGATTMAAADEATSPGNGTAATGKEAQFYGMDGGMIFRASIIFGSLAALILLYFLVKLARSRGRTDGIRRYDVLSAKQLQPDLVLDDSDSEDDIFTDDRRLVASPSKRP